MPVPHFFVRKDKPKVLVECSNPHYLSEQESACGLSKHPRRDSEYSPKSPRPLFRENSSRVKSAFDRIACEEPFDYDHYICVNARWLDHVNQSESIRSGRIKDHRKHPRPRRPHKLLERIRLRLRSLAAEELNRELSCSRSSPAPIIITAKVTFPDVHMPIRATSVKRRMNSDDLRVTAASHEAAGYGSSPEMAADDLQHLAEVPWRNF